MKTRSGLIILNKAKKILKSIEEELTLDYETSDGGSDHGHRKANLLFCIEDLLKLYKLKPTNMPCLGNFLDVNGGL